MTMCACVCTCVYVYVHVYMCMYMCVCMCAYVCTCVVYSTLQHDPTTYTLHFIHVHIYTFLFTHTLHPYSLLHTPTSPLHTPSTSHLHIPLHTYTSILSTSHTHLSTAHTHYFTSTHSSSHIHIHTLYFTHPPLHCTHPHPPSHTTSQALGHFVKAEQGMCNWPHTHIMSSSPSQYNQGSMFLTGCTLARRTPSWARRRMLGSGYQRPQA